MADITKIKLLDGATYDLAVPASKVKSGVLDQDRIPDLNASKISSGTLDAARLPAQYIEASAKGAASGVAELDEYGKVPSSQLPSYVDDVLEYSTRDNFPLMGTTGIIYVDTSTNLTYRWGGSEYIEISPSLALGTTSATAYRGDYGNTAYIHATDPDRLTTAQSAGLYKISITGQGHVAEVLEVGKSDITALGIPGADTTYAFDGTYNASTNKAATVSTVTNAISALDGGTIGTPGAGKTITSLSQANGNVSAAFGDISITKSQVSDFPTLGAAAAKGVTDKTSAAAPSSTDTNLITGRTLYYAIASTSEIDALFT